MKIRKYIGFFIFLALSIFAGFAVFLATLGYMSEHTADDEDVLLANVSLERDVDLGSVYTMTSMVDKVYSGYGLKNDEEREISYVLLSDGVLCCFYSNVDSEIEGTQIKVMGKASFNGGIVILDNCAIVRDDE